MSGTVDDRIVAMKFDNAEFERKIGDTMRSIDNLKTSLKFAGATQGLQDISAAAQHVNLSPVGSAIDGISSKFLALATIGITALSNITTRAISAGAQMLSSFTFEPIHAGFAEFETNMNSIQTILSNTNAKGTTLDEVNAALNQLNTYSDQTIYNFGQMARNIGTFTAAGVDLDTSVASIKGIANLAAISGSSADQAATAMYQLSQAIATGAVKLMDWNSVVNAGMGGEVFQRALFESGKAMGTLNDVPMSTTFDEWTDAGNSFRESLQDGWITGEVLTNTLQGFTGDLTEAQIMSMGYTQEQAAEMIRLGALGKAAATEIKTLTGLLGTIKETIGSGWSKSFQLIFGDFEESKALFTGLNNVIGGFIGRMSDARNNLLQGWKDLGGRDALIENFGKAFGVVAGFLDRLGKAFREIFPAMDPQRLYDLTIAFGEFLDKITVGPETLDKFKIIFQGFFAVVEIGWEIIKNIAGVFGELVSAIAPAGSGILDFGVKISETLIGLNEALVAGGGIKDFFEKIKGFIRDPIAYLEDFKEKIEGLFEGGEIPGASAAVTILDRLKERFQHLVEVAEHIRDIWDRFTDFFQPVVDVFQQVWEYISTWFGELGHNIAQTFSEGDFDEAVDLINVGLLGGIALMVRRFLNGGFLDLGTGMIDRIRGVLDGLTGTLRAMQADLRASALLKIAAAVGILAISMTVLASIDSAGLTRALTAIGVGMGQLVAAMALMDQLSSNFAGAARIGIIAGAMILLATAVGILAISIKSLAELSWEELARGLGGVAVALGLMVAAVNLMPTGSMIRAGVAMIPMALGLRLMANAVEAFSEMSWESMAQGLIGVAGGLGLLVLAMNFMPTAGMIAAGIGIIFMAGGLRLLQEAVEAFASMEWESMGQGLVGIGGALLIVGLAMNLMPPSMPLIALGLIGVGAALLIMAEAVEQMAQMQFGEMAKGLGAIAAMLLILAVGLNAMSGALPGAAALVVASGALFIMAEVLNKLKDLSIGQIAAGLGALAGVLAILGGAAYLIGPLAPALLGLGAGMALIGGAFALFGFGVNQVAKALETLVRLGGAGIEAFSALLEEIITRIPRFAAALGRGIVDGATELLEGLPMLLDIVREILMQVLDTVIEMVPKIAEALGEIITEGLILIREKYPDILETALFIVLSIFEGIRDNAYQLISAATLMIEEIVRGLVDNMPMLVDNAVDLITAFLNALATRAADLVAAGLNLLTQLLQGIADNIGQVIAAASNVITQFLLEIGNHVLEVIDTGFKILKDLLQGIADNITEVAVTVINIITEFVTTMAEEYLQFVDAGFKALTDFLSGIGDNIIEVVNTVGTIITEFIGAVAEKGGDIATAGADALIDFLTGVADNLYRVAKTVGWLVIAFLDALADLAIDIARGGADVLIDFLNGLADAIRDKAPELRAAGGNIASALLEGLTGGLSRGAGGVVSAIANIAVPGLGIARRIFGIGGPSKVFCGYGLDITAGLVAGIERGGRDVKASTVALATTTARSFNKALSNIPFSELEMADLNPVITPVLDLSRVEREAVALKKMMAIQSITAEVSVNQANLIAKTTDRDDDGVDNPVYTGPQQVTFEQNNYSPSALSVNDIYRNTRSQFALAKEELGIS